MRTVLSILLVIIGIKSFGQTKPYNNANYQSVKLEKNDKEFLRLKDSAQKHLPEFLDLLKKHGSDLDNYRFVVKSEFVEKEEHEHMWSQVVGYNNEILKGVFIDSAFTLKDIKTGDTVSIKKASVEDWAVFQGQERIAGDFSDKYLNSKKED